jgi:hypothetical protein
MESQYLRHAWERVEFRATKDGNSEVIVLTREAAELRCAELSADGWRVEIVELDREGATE